MASYFDLPPQQNAGAANIEAVPENERKQLGRMSMLSPAVTQLLDDLGNEHSDSDSEEASLSEKGDPDEHDSRQSLESKESDTPKSASSLLSPSTAERPQARESVQDRSSPARAGGGSTKRKQPHMARFHSLRSMLFSNTIESKIKDGSKDIEKEKEAANKWRSQHEQRQGLNRPKSPEQDKQGKGLGSRLKTTIRRMTSKEVPTMDTLKEDGAAHDFSDHGSTASSDNEQVPYQWKPREEYESSIDHSDDEDLVRWVSRRDPPSDGEARASKAPAITLSKPDTGHDSIGESDVEDLARWASAKSSDRKSPSRHHTGYSDVSTESDSEAVKEPDSSEDEDPDELVRWVSHRDGPTAGPVRQKRGSGSNTSKSGINYDSDVPELGRWVTRHDGTSGESNANSPTLEAPEEHERGRPLSREGRPKPRGHLTYDDIGELVRHISRADMEPRSDPAVDVLQSDEEEKKKALGMSVDEGSLSHSDVQNLIEHVKSSHSDVRGVEPTVQPITPNLAETGDLREFDNSKPENRSQGAAQKHLQASRGEDLQIEKNRRESENLADEDLDDILMAIRGKGKS
jgi:hypothetical protein